jgi:hypothetical protein
MKKLLTIITLAICSMTMMAQYVDLGLPSGTHWKATHEMGYYTYYEAKEKFPNNLPTLDQITELKLYCTFSWNGKECVVTGPNGNTIKLPAMGFRHTQGYVTGVGQHGNYWSSTPRSNAEIYDFSVSSSGIYVGSSNMNFGFCVRLVKSATNEVPEEDYRPSKSSAPQSPQSTYYSSKPSHYLDLGLPSGTLWKTTNEDGLYDYDEAATAFGDRLPTKWQMEELKEHCTWTWYRDSYMVTGPNGAVLALPANGVIDCGGESEPAGEVGGYWTQDYYANGGEAAILGFESDYIITRNIYPCYSLSVRLVK